MTTRILNSTLSSWLRYYYVCLQPPMKYRLWNLMRKMTRNARLKLAYAGDGWITLDDRDYLQRIILVKKYYEPEIWESLAARATEGEILWDVGAHVGSFAIRGLLDSRVREVHCFEPNPEIVSILQTNLDLNPGRHKCHRLALSDQNERRPLYLGPHGNTGMASLHRRTHANPLTISCSTVDAVVEKGIAPPPSLMKVDVEGWEEQVFRGARELLSTRPPKAIVFETTFRDTAVSGDGRVARLLRSHGYHVTWIPSEDSANDGKENYLATL
jgi:FkbM family methyltransferase